MKGDTLGDKEKSQTLHFALLEGLFFVTVMAVESCDYCRDLFSRRWMEGRADRGNLTSREVFQ